MSEPVDSKTKLKRFILVGLLLIASVVGWHIYEYLIAGKSDADHETATDHDIMELTKNLFDLEATHNAYLAKIDFQGKTRPFRRDDQAAHPLLQVHNDEQSLDKSSTIYLMKRLYDNYELDTHIKEKVGTDNEEQEELDFLQAILKTAIMKRTMKFLQTKGVVTAENSAQLQLLKNIWFTQYSRGGGHIGSSGFEHVFLAELKENTVLGLHNWVYFSEQEKLGNLDYKGYMDHLELGKHDQYLAAVRFNFHNIVKTYNTLFIGTSPELEMSLYTVCFLLEADHSCPVQFGTTKFAIITHSWKWHGKTLIASAYPSIET